MNELDDKIEILEELIKGLRSKLQSNNVLPSLKTPTPQTTMAGPSTPKLPGVAQSSKKNPIKQVEQIQNKDIKDMKMREAREVLNINKSGQWDLSTKEDSIEKDEKVDTYHIHQNGVRITDKPLTIKQIDERHGGVKKLEGAGYRLHLVKDKK